MPAELNRGGRLHFMNRKFTSLFGPLGVEFSKVNFCHLRGRQGDIHNEINHRYEFTYTDFGEDRKELWSDSYLKGRSEVYHLGIDIQVPWGTRVYSPVSGVIKLVLVSPPGGSRLGWGTRVDILDDFGLLWIFGHLGSVDFKYYISGDVEEESEYSEPNHRDWDTSYLACPERKISKGDAIGSVGHFGNNGRCFEHLHVQIFKNGSDKHLTRNPACLIDGYGYRRELVFYENPLDILED